MNFSLKLAAATLAFAGVAGVANADTGNPASDTATATVNVIDPITVTQVDDLDFGNITNVGGGTVTVTTAGARSQTTGVGLVAGTHSAASFNITAATSYVYNLANSGPVNLDGPGLDEAVLVLSHAGTGTGTGSAVATPVGGTLTFGADDDPGVYTGTFSLTATYQ
jgi:Domain of unknown function (DUF4402)